MKFIEIQSKTLLYPIITTVLDIFPASIDKILLNGSLEANIHNIIYAHDRVDLCSGSKRVFLVEHALALCALFGVHAAIIEGKNNKWDFNRPSHVVCFQNDHKPSDVLGEETGQICSKPFDRKPKTKPIPHYTTFNVADKELSLEDQHGNTIKLYPPLDYDNLKVSVSSGEQDIITNFSIYSGLNDTIPIPQILNRL